LAAQIRKLVQCDIPYGPQIRGSFAPSTNAMKLFPIMDFSLFDANHGERCFFKFSVKLIKFADWQKRRRRTPLNSYGLLADS
jgi:hypothetical protein